MYISAPAISSEIGQINVQCTFLALNRESFEQLVTFVDFAAKKLTLAFVSVNFEADRETLLRSLEADPRCQDVQFERLHLADPGLRFLREALLERVQQHLVEAGKKRILVITGLEQSIGMAGLFHCQKQKSRHSILSFSILEFFEPHA